MNGNPNIGSLFGGVSQLADGSYVQAGSGVGRLGDDGAVMMISGVGSAPQVATSRSDAGTPRQGVFQLPDLSSLLAAKVRIGTYDIPVWVVILAAAGVVGVAGWYFFIRKGK